MNPQAFSFELAADHLRDAVFILDPNGRILWANQAAASAAGRAPDSLINLGLTEILTPRSIESVEPLFGSEGPPAGPGSPIELDILRSDLSSRRLEVTFSPLAGGNPQVLVAIGRDVSQRYFLEEERRRADFQTLQFQFALLELSQLDSSNLEEFLSHVTALAAATLDVARVSVWIYSETEDEIRCTYLFDREQGSRGLSANLQIGRYPRHFGALRDCRTIAARDARNHPLTAEMADYLAARGTISVLDVPIRREGKPIGVLSHEHTGESRRWQLDEQNFAASVADLIALALETDRRRTAERELHVSLENLELFFSQSLDGFFFMMLDEPIRWGDDVDKEAVLDYVFEHQRITKVNAAILEQYAVSREQFLGRTPRDLFIHNLAHGKELWRRMFDAGRLHVESDERRFDGSRMWVEGDYICFHDADGRITGHFGIQRDVTERKQLEEMLKGQNIYLREELRSQLNFEEIVGASPVMQKVFRSIERVAQTDSSVLLLGETGTGKELIARAVHNLSRRKQNVMVKVNCAALPASLVESELFGHEKGAFTGAVAQKKGRFELAHQGTIFLDEVGELPLEIQTKLLRVLQEHEFERVGGSHTLKVDARVIAATNRSLAEEVRRGAFRADLFYRLNVFPIEVPPLRQRKEDIRLLAKDLVRKACQQIGKRINTISREALERLECYDWPGNVRELANILERGVILCEGEVLLEAHIALTDPGSAAPDQFPTLEEAERRHILQALERTGWVLAGPKGAAELLGMNRSTLWSRMKKLGIETSGTEGTRRTTPL